MWQGRKRKTRVQDKERKKAKRGGWERDNERHERYLLGAQIKREVGLLFVVLADVLALQARDDGLDHSNVLAHRVAKWEIERR